MLRSEESKKDATTATASVLNDLLGCQWKDYLAFKGGTGLSKEPPA